MNLKDFIKKQIVEHLMAGRFNKAYFLEEILHSYERSGVDKMKIYVYTITERCPWTDQWETRITGVIDKPVSYSDCDEVQVWEDGFLSFIADKGTERWNEIHEGK